MLRLRCDREMTMRLAAFSVMTPAAALVSPLVNIAVRDHLALQLGWQQVGYWQAVSGVWSDAYLLFLTAAIDIISLPKLASIGERASLVAELRNAYRYILPVVVVLAAAVYVLREWVTRLLLGRTVRPPTRCTDRSWWATSSRSPPSLFPT